MKTGVIFIMFIQVFLYSFSVYQIINGSIYFGMFNMTLNSVFFTVNIYTLKRLIKSVGKNY